MTHTITGIMLGIKERLDTIDRLNAYSVEPASPIYPAAWPLLRTIDYDADMDGHSTATIGITVAVGGRDLGQAQSNLAYYLSPAGTRSIKGAIEGAADHDVTLGGACDSVRVTRVEGVFASQIAGVGPIVQAVFICEVFA
jgi:hypothetical protein